MVNLLALTVVQVCCTSLACLWFFFAMVCFVLIAFFYVLGMAGIKHTAKPADGDSSEEGVTFEFGASRVQAGELEEILKSGWIPRADVRYCEGESVPDPRDDEVVVFKEFFEAGLHRPPHPLVVGSLRRFNLRFHQLTPSSFVKLSIYVWGCKSQGVEPDLEGFVRLHQVHTQPRKIKRGEDEVLG